MTVRRAVTQSVVRELRDRLAGEVIAPGDAGYDEARAVWNARFDRRPGAIARCSGVEDVVAAVEIARENDTLLAVRSGGHDYAGNGVCDDGLVVDLASMGEVRVDAAAKTARVGPGARWRDFDRAAQAHELATTGGTVSTVGVAGFALGGGTGYLVRKHGMCLDNVRAADVVTADGQRVHASSDENTDLFWALRGGGGNLGIVTGFQFALHELAPRVLAGQIIHRLDDAPAVLRFWREFMSDAPGEVQCYAFFIRIPPLPEFPEELHGQVVIDLVAAYAGPVADGERVLAPLREFGSPVIDAVQQVDYTALQQAFDAGTPKGQRWCSRGQYLADLPDDAVELLVERAAGLTGPFTMAYVEPLGGAVARVPVPATAFPHRDAPYSFHVLTGWTDAAGDDEHIAWTRGFHHAMARFASGGVYVNLLSSDEKDRVRSAYGANYDRLVKVKRAWDPDNLFRVNHNVAP